MNADRWRKIDELFDAVLEIPKAGREAFLAKKCAGDEILRREVSSLLKAHKETDSFLENSAMNLMAKEIAQNETTVAEVSIIGRELGSYRIERPLGAGGMGEVYLAYDSKLKRQVALKILPAAFVLDDERIKRFEREARAVSALNHPNIVTIYDFGQVENVNYIVTEFIEGKTVRELINSNLPLKETLSVVSQTCDALAAAHKLGIIHRDIKPENIMMRPDGYVKVLDFGLAKLNPQADSIHVSLTNYTQKGMIIGTLAYMSPEQISDEKVDHRTDLWSLGVVLYEMLTGKNPFKGENRQATMNAILTIDPLPVSEIKASLPAELDAILSKALEKDADVSYQTASDFRADLKRVRREIDSSPSLRTTGGTRKSAAARTRRNYLSLAVGAILLILTGFGIRFFLTKNDAKKAVEAVEWSRAQQIQLTNFAAIKSDPSLSPDGKSFIYTNETVKDTDIFLQRIGGKNPVNLTADSPDENRMAIYSPDGNSIAFRSERKPGGIYLMEETGENVRRVSDFGFHPSWSPDGKQIVVSDKVADVATSHTVPNSSLSIIEVATGNRKLLDTKGDAIQPAWSPHGQRIAFWFVEEGKLGELATIPANGGEPIVIAPSAAMDWNPVWSPDGRYIFFGSDRGGNMNIWRVAVDEETGKALGEPESVTMPALYVRHFAFSRDGKTLAYIRYETQSNLQSIAFDPLNLKTVGEVNFITRGNKQISTPALSPNGAEFVIRQPALTQEDLVIFNRDGSNWRTLTNDKFRDRVPRWSPDGKTIAFASDRSGKYQIWMINADGSDLRQITFTEKTGATAPVFSPDGSRLAFSEINGKISLPSVLDLTKTWQEQTPAPLAPLPGYKGSYPVRDWSPDGNKLLLLMFETDNNEQGILIYDFKTLTYEKMTDSGSYPVWLNDSRHFMFDKRDSLYICDTQTKTVKEIYKIPAYELQHANLSSDNHLIYFRYLQVDTDVWMLDASQN